MDDVIRRLIAAGELPAADQLVGAPTTELDLWELELGRKLPTDYRSFMEIAGGTSRARLFRGSGFFWPVPPSLRSLARESLAADEYAAIPSEALVILEHQGYIFAWIDTRDPAAPVYVTQPADINVREIKRIADSFREWMLVIAND